MGFNIFGDVQPTIHVLSGYQATYQAAFPYRIIIDDVIDTHALPKDDANDDGLVDADDLAAIASYILTGEAPAQWSQLKADANQDGVIVVGDVVATEQIILQQTFDGYDYVDLGLRDDQGRIIYWATCNVGAEQPEDFGLFFAWGETTGYGLNDPRTFDWAHYQWMQEGQGAWNYITKYTFDDNQTAGIWYTDGTFQGDGHDTHLPEDDAAHTLMGGCWRTPTIDELDYLNQHCDWTWDGSQSGWTVSSQTDPAQSIFLPATGYRRGDSHFGLRDTTYDISDAAGSLWSSSLKTTDYALFLQFDASQRCSAFDDRCTARPIRPVCVIGR